MGSLNLFCFYDRRDLLRRMTTTDKGDTESDDSSIYKSSHGMEGMIWRVGCYKINPTTPSGQKFFILHMLVLPLIPITALVIQNGVTMNTLMAYSSRVSAIRKQVRGAMEIAVFIQNIQEERAEVALYIFLNNSNANFDMSEVLSNNNSSEHDFSL